MNEATEVLEPPTDVSTETTDATPEAPAPDTTAPEPAAAPTEQAARTRDPATGRFIKADGTLEPEAAAPTGGAPPASPPTAPQTPVVPVASDPWTFRAGGQRIPITGATVSPEGNLTIPADQIPNVRQLLGEGMAYRTTFRQREQEHQRAIKEAETRGSASAQKYNRASVRLWEVAEQLLGDRPQELELLRREIALELKSADLEIPKAPTQEAGEPDPQQLIGAASQMLSEYVEELLERPQAKAVYDTPDKRQALTKRLQRRLGAYFVQHEGQYALHENVVDADFEEELQEKLAAKKTADDARKAAEFNAKRNQPSAAIPPVVSSKGPAATAVQPSTFKDRDEWRRKHGMM